MSSSHEWEAADPVCLDCVNVKDRVAKLEASVREAHRALAASYGNAGHAFNVLGAALAKTPMASVAIGDGELGRANCHCVCTKCVAQTTVHSICEYGCDLRRREAKTSETPPTTSERPSDSGPSGDPAGTANAAAPSPGGVPKSPGAIPRTSDVKHDRNCGYGMLEDSDWQDCTCHVHAARKAKRSGAKTDCENCHGTGKWHDIVFDEERQCPCVNGEAMKLPRTKEPLMPVPPVPDDVNSRLAAAARIDTQTGQRTNEARPHNFRGVFTCEFCGEPRTHASHVEEPKCVICGDFAGHFEEGIGRVCGKTHQGTDSARTCEDCEDAPAILCRSCVKHACEVAVDHLVDSEGREHCWGCLRGDRRKCPGMPRTEPARNKVRACNVWSDDEKGICDLPAGHENHRFVPRKPGTMRVEARPETALPVDGDELAPLRERMAKGRKKYPNGCTILSLLDEAGEVAHAVNKYEGSERIRSELLDVAAVAMRLYFCECDTGLAIEGLVQRRTDTPPQTGSVGGKE